MEMNVANEGHTIRTYDNARCKRTVTLARFHARTHTRLETASHRNTLISGVAQRGQLNHFSCSWHDLT